MTLTYFDISKEVQLNSSGFGIAVLKPDVGQYWLPTFVHVGTATFNGSCSVHIGGIGVYDFTTQVDETGAGGNDTTAACSGMIVSPGMGVAAQFFGGSANDTALMRVVGVSADAPPTIGIDPGIPGHKFSGTSSSVFIQNQPISVSISGTPAVTISGTPNVAVTNTPNVAVTNTPSVTVSGTPNVAVTNTPTVSEANKQMFANQPPVPFDLTLAAGATSVLVAAATQQLYLHAFRVENASPAAPFYPQLQDTGGTTLANSSFNTESGTIPAGEWAPVNGYNDFKGAPVTVNLGIQLKNNGIASSRFIGYLTYSK